MTEFAPTLRHYCRNPRCRMRLKAPVENPHKAFCTPGCHASFYLKRCLVCEQPIVKKLSSRELCNKPKCYSTFRGDRERFRYPCTGHAGSAAKSADEMGTKTSPQSRSTPSFANAPLNILGGGTWCWPNTPRLDTRTLENIIHREIAAAPEVVADSDVKLVPREHSINTLSPAVW